MTPALDRLYRFARWMSWGQAAFAIAMLGAVLLGPGWLVVACYVPQMACIVLGYVAMHRASRLMQGRLADLSARASTRAERWKGQS